MDNCEGQVAQVAQRVTSGGAVGMSAERRAEFRLAALQMAHDHGEHPEFVTHRAKAYFAFLTGEQAAD